MAASHLDLGCGLRPKNPYGHAQVFGVDIRAGLQAPGVEPIEAVMYGFHGDFELRRQMRIHPRGAYEPRDLARTVLRQLDGWVDKRSHLVWELQAIKASAQHE